MNKVINVFETDMKTVSKYCLVSFVIGLVLVSFPLREVINIVRIIVGFILMGLSGYSLFTYSYKHRKEDRFIIDIVGLVLGLLMVSITNYLGAIVLSGCLIALDVAFLIKNKFNIEMIKKYLIYIIISILAILVMLFQMNTFFMVLGYILIVVSLVSYLVMYLVYKKSKVKVIRR